MIRNTYDPKVTIERNHNAEVFRETTNIIKAGYYTTPSGKRIDLDMQPMIDGSRCYHKDLGSVDAPKVEDEHSREFGWKKKTASRRPNNWSKQATTLPYSTLPAPDILAVAWKAVPVPKRRPSAVAPHSLVLSSASKPPMLNVMATSCTKATTTPFLVHLTSVPSIRLKSRSSVRLALTIR